MKRAKNGTFRPVGGLEEGGFFSVFSLGYKSGIKWPKNGTFRPIRGLEEGVFD